MSEPAQSQNEKNEKFRELMYSFNSFTAVMWPVTFTMILASLAIVYINDGTNGNGSGGLATLPTIVDESAADGSLAKAGGALLNALVIIGIVAGMTFLMVILYYFQCMIVFIGWLVISTGMLLSFTTSFMVYTAFEVYHVPFDSISYWFFWYNFAVCGILAIFYQKGIPSIVTQTYLVIVSVVMAWLLTKYLPAWTSWCLLVLLALYDLCAVLTPCGPLKCLIEIAQSRPEGTSSLPGLLYEAAIRDDHGTGRASNNNTETAIASPTISFDQELGTTPERQVPQNVAPPKAVEEYQSIADRSSIKLGLGDFVFYSVLVGRAALYGFTTFIAVFITVLGGLGMTLFLLAVYHKALPALPISIILGVIFYFSTEWCVTPMVDHFASRYESF
mmetsp:Transcript_13151/g.21335  ORF Transcript_13151/g.21335 Transcript_13151/m.21335 type:complete len:389 (+) Transcript_13151:2270-3436(+)